MTSNFFWIQPFHISHSSRHHTPDPLSCLHRLREPLVGVLPLPHWAETPLRSCSPYLVRVDGVEISHHPVNVGQRRARAIAGDDGVLTFPYCQVHMAHTDLREV